MSGIIKFSKLLIKAKIFRRVAIKPKELVQILKPLLLATCGVYTGLLTGHLYLAHRIWKRKAKRDRFVMWMFLANGFVCGSILILAAVLLGIGWAQVISADLVLWVSQSRSWRGAVLTLYEDLFSHLWCPYGQVPDASMAKGVPQIGFWTCWPDRFIYQILQHHG